MSRRLIAGIAALVLAVLAALLVFTYVSNADRRAMSEMTPTEVFVVAEQIPAGTPAESLADFLTVEEIPAAAVVPGGVTDLNQVAGQVTTTALEPGEQLLMARFVSPEEYEGTEDFSVPEGFHQLSIALPTSHVIGGKLSPGDTVGFFVSGREELTHLRLHKVLVTDVRGAVTTVVQDDGTETTQPAADIVMVTLAVSAADAELVVNAAEFHSIWLSLEPPEAPNPPGAGTRVVDGEELLPWP